MNDARKFLQPVQSLAQEVKATINTTVLQSLAEEDRVLQEDTNSTAPIFRSHCACEQG